MYNFAHIFQKQCPTEIWKLPFSWGNVPIWMRSFVTSVGSSNWIKLVWNSIHFEEEGWHYTYLQFFVWKTVQNWSSESKSKKCGLFPQLTCTPINQLYSMATWTGFSVCFVLKYDANLIWFAFRWFQSHSAQVCRLLADHQKCKSGFARWSDCVRARQ